MGLGEGRVGGQEICFELRRVDLVEDLPLLHLMSFDERPFEKRALDPRLNVDALRGPRLAHESCLVADVLLGDRLGDDAGERLIVLGRLVTAVGAGRYGKG
ncbi:MAG: hypothetical protein A49_30730 [Methyloceanibacter sp.]|nr:MAG: hypothetical protein A49_30730 [Methyloceanibacter sp.]